MEWFIKTVKKFSFSGRARRKEYWMFSLFVVLIALALIFFDTTLGIYSEEAEIGLLSGIFMLAIVVQSLAVGVRRLHDSGLRGWWLLVSFIPYVGAIIWLILMVMDGQEGENRFGPDPKQAT